MVNYTPRLDDALRFAATAHDSINHVRKSTDIPYIIHPMAVMAIASKATEDEDVLIASLLHDVLEDVSPQNETFNSDLIRQKFGERVLKIVLDVTKDEDETDWHKRARTYLHHLDRD